MNAYPTNPAIFVKALALLVLPGNVATSALHLGNLVNVVWNYAGDDSTDVGSSETTDKGLYSKTSISQVSWYTKRAALAAVYSSTELYLVDDPSPGHDATRAFLERRLADMDRLGRLRSESSKTLDFVGRSLLGLAESVGLNW